MDSYIEKQTSFFLKRQSLTPGKTKASTRKRPAEKMLGSALRNIDIVVIMQTLAGDLTKRMFTILRGKGIGKFIAQLVSWVFFLYI